jgi:dephospho-CoA kinase
MVKVGILGPVGSGKSFVANIFRTLGFNVFSADEEVSKIYQNNRIVNKKISKSFRLKLYKNRINKEELREFVKKYPKKFKFLNKIIHPIVRKELINFLKKNKNQKLVVLDIPLLIENKLFQFVDIFVFIKTKSVVFNSRIAKRKNLDQSFLRILRKQQVTEKTKEGYADYVVFNNSKDEVKQQIRNIVNKIILND